MTRTHTNFWRRMERATLALNAYPTDGPEPTETVITDLLSDLRHYCEFHGLDFESLESMACIHYNEESNRERNEDAA